MRHPESEADVTALFDLPTPAASLLALLMALAVIGLVAWALHLMQSASDSREFSLMLAGCMVCSAAVGLATVMVLTFTSTSHLDGGPLQNQRDPSAGISLDAIVLPWDAPNPSQSLAAR